MCSHYCIQSLISIVMNPQPQGARYAMKNGEYIPKPDDFEKDILYYEYEMFEKYILK